MGPIIAHLRFEQAQPKIWAWQTSINAKTKLALYSWKPTFFLRNNMWSFSLSSVEYTYEIHFCAAFSLSLPLSKFVWNAGIFDKRHKNAETKIHINILKAP